MINSFAMVHLMKIGFFRCINLREMQKPQVLKLLHVFVMVLKIFSDVF